jgi:transcriptional regulator with XRE-family HTH domain
MDLYKKVLGRNLRYYRQKNGYGLCEIAFNANISSSYLSDIEHARKEPSESVLSNLCNALDIPFYQLYEDIALEIKREMRDKYELSA